jgi:PAT family beta-lactamase induction signal transducer AmpG
LADSFGSRLRSLGGASGQSWAEAAKVYTNPLVVALFFLGISSGAPFGILAEPLIARLAEGGISKTEIGFFALLSLPYSLKVLWAPIIDRVPVPGLSRLLGRRRAWALTSQVCLLGAIIALGGADPVVNLALTATCALFVAFCSATQDIVLDAYRIEILDDKAMAAGAATMVFGWRAGQVGGAAAGLVLADILPWSVVFALLGVSVVIGMITILVCPEPKSPKDLKTTEDQAEIDKIRGRLATVLDWIKQACIAPLKDLTVRRGWLAVLLFVLLYKFGDAVLTVMKVPFFLEIGFSKTEIAEVVKVFGLFPIIAGGLLGGLLLARVGLMSGLLICGALMGASNLVFVLQAYAGHDLTVLAFTIAVENVTTGMGTAAFVAYLSSLCSVAHTATQYALLTSLMAMSRTVLSSGAGWLADSVTWPTFFVLTTVAALPGLCILLWMMRDPTRVDGANPGVVVDRD